MEPFINVTSVGVPLDQSNVDTDQIIPAEFLRKPRSVGFGQFLFHRRRFGANGEENPEFPLNHPVFRRGRVLVVGANFGCGSSRESAVWALIDGGADAYAPGRFRSIIAPSFGDIFYSNAGKNGLLCVRLAADDCARLRGQLREQPGAEITVDLPSQQVTGPDGGRYTFEIDPLRKECLLEGIDDIQLTLARAAAIDAWEAQAATLRPWAQRASLSRG